MSLPKKSPPKTPNPARLHPEQATSSRSPCHRTTELNNFRHICLATKESCLAFFCAILPRCEADGALRDQNICAFLKLKRLKINFPLFYLDSTFFLDYQKASNFHKMFHVKHLPREA